MSGLPQPTREAGVSRAYRYRFSLVACARWEEQDIAEWVEYHRAVGFDHIYVYSNDDDPAACMKALMPYFVGASPFVTFRHFPKGAETRPQQQRIYHHFLTHHLHESEWFGFLDIDEFYVFRDHDNVASFMRLYEEEYDSVYFNWLIFGAAGKAERTPESILLTHVMRAAQVDLHTKHLTRSAAIDAEHVNYMFANGALGFWHFWNQYATGGMRLTNVLKDDVSRYVDDFPQQALDYVRTPGVSEAMIATAYIAHFQFKSEADFARRVRRGGSHTVALWQQQIDSGAFRQRLLENNSVWDPYLAEFWLRHLRHALPFSTEVPVPAPPMANVALWKPSLQSTTHVKTERDPPASAVRGHANDGVRRGTYGFATQAEDAPWWMVDLLAPHAIHEFHVYNRVDGPGLAERASHLVIEVSLDWQVWREVCRLDGTTVFGGIGSRPLVVTMAEPVHGRYVKLSSARPTKLHLDEIEIFGTAL